MIPQSADVNLETGEVQEVTLITAGSFAKVHVQAPIVSGRESCVTGGSRGKVRGRSKASRRRFQTTMARVDLSAVKGCLFITLTWAALPGHSDMARYLDSYLKWLSRRFGGAPIAWAKEPGGKNGRWHFHLCVFAREWIHVSIYQQAWNHIAGHFAGNVDVEFKQDSNVVRYMAKYLSKEVSVWDAKSTAALTIKDAPVAACVEAAASSLVDLDTIHISPQADDKGEETGRTWGWRMYKKLPLAVVRRMRITLDTAHRIRRVLRGLEKAQKRQSRDHWAGKVRGFKRIAVGGNKVYVSRGDVDFPDWMTPEYYDAHGEEHIAEYVLGKAISADKTWRHFAEKGSHLGRGGFDRHGWSCFMAQDSSCVEVLGAYFDGLN